MLLAKHDNGLEIYQLLAGRDFCKRNDDGRRSGVSQMSAQMANFVYCVCDRKTSRAMLFDACWDVDGIWSTVHDLGFTSIETCAYTHHHFDHTGGHLPKSYTGGRDVAVPGVAEVLRKISMGVVSAGKDDVAKIIQQCQIPIEGVRSLGDGDRVWETENIMVEAWHTPGHTAGSMTFVVFSKDDTNAPPFVVTGDTLFIGSCGRYDLPDSNVNHLLESLERLSTLPANAVVCPGHNYAMTTQTTIGEERLTNQMMQQAMKYGTQLREKKEMRANNTCSTTRSTTRSTRENRRENRREEQLKRNDTKCSTLCSSSALCSNVPLPDYLGVAREVLESHVVWKTIHKEVQCYECDERRDQYEPNGASL